MVYEHSDCSGRYKYLDVAKGITLIFIMMGHSCGFPWGMDRYCTAYFVALFFVVSGYLQKSVRPDGAYICKRFRRIILPYFAYNLLIYIIYIVWKGFNSLSDALYAAAGILYSTHCLYFPVGTEDNLFFFRIENDPTWFLTAFFCANIALLFYIKYGTKVRYKIAIFMLFAVITQVLYDCPIFLPWGMDRAFIGADFMIFGYEFRKIDWKKMNIKWMKYVGMVCLLILYKVLTDYNLGIGLSTREYGCRGIFSVGLCLLIGIIGSVICMWGSQFISRILGIGTVFALIGKESLAIMAMHLIIFRIYDWMLQHKLPQGASNWYYWCFALSRIMAACVIIIGTAYIVRNIRSKRHRETA